MVLFRIFFIGFLIILPISVFGVASSYTTEPVVVENIKPGNYYINITTQSWQKTSDELSSKAHKLFINDFGVINQINPSNTGNSFDLPFDPYDDNSNFLADERTPVSGIPEPTTILLLGLGSLGLAAFRKRQ